jgi:hypothetical protein
VNTPVLTTSSFFFLKLFLGDHDGFGLGSGQMHVVEEPSARPKEMRLDVSVCSQRPAPLSFPLAGRSRSRVVLTLASLAACAAVLVVLSTSTRSRRDALEDPSMPGPMIGGNDEDAMPDGGAAWGGVGPGGTFLGRSMSKRRRVITDQKDLWRMAERGIGNLVAMSKGKWHPGPAARERQEEPGRSRPERSDGRAPEERRSEYDYDEGRAREHVNDGHGRLRAADGGTFGDGGRESELHDREAVDDRRGAALDQAISDAGEGDGSHRPMGNDVAALRSAIARMKEDIGSTKRRLEARVLRDEDKARRQRQGRDDIAMRAPVGTSVLASAPSSPSAEQMAGDGAKVDALGHKIEWPLLERPRGGPSDADEAAESLSDSMVGLEKMVGSVEHDVHGFLEKSRPQARTQHSKTALEFRQRWGDTSQRAPVSGAPSTGHQGNPGDGSGDHGGDVGRLDAPRGGQSLSRRAGGVSPEVAEGGTHKKVYMRNELSELAQERQAAHLRHSKQVCQCRVGLYCSLGLICSSVGLFCSLVGLF